jgi:polar amino acid transport system permease protein
MNFDTDLILRSLPLVAAGLGVTLKLLVFSSLLGVALAVATLLMRLSGRRFLSWPAQAYIYFFRGTPILVQIFIIYYGLPQFDVIRSSIFWPILREPFGCCVLALGLNSGAYVSEILRGGVLGVDKGLHEAGKALGLSAPQRFIYVTAPIAIRLSLPAYSNEFISTLKATALASTVTLMDVTGVARTLVSETYAPYEIFTSAAIIYLAAAWLAYIGLGWIETRSSQYVRKGH